MARELDAIVQELRQALMQGIDVGECVSGWDKRRELPPAFWIEARCKLSSVSSQILECSLDKTLAWTYQKILNAKF
jgi:hypothetical protein